MTKRSQPARPPLWLRPAFWRGLVRLVVATVLLVLAAAVWVLVYPPALNPVRDELQGWLSERLEHPVRFQRLTWTWDRGLTIRAGSVRVGEDGLSADEVRLGLAIPPLLRGELDLRRLELRGLRLVVARDQHGQLSVGGFRLDPQRSRVFPLLARFHQLRITGGQVVWRDRSRSRPVALTLDQWRLGLERGARNHLVDLTGEVAGTTVAVRGSIDRFAEGPAGWRVNVQTRADGLRAEALRAYFPRAMPAAVPGPLSLWAEVVGGFGQATRINGHFRLAPGELRWPEHLRRPVAALSGRGAFRYRGTSDGHRLRLERAELSAGELTVSGRAGLRWGRDRNVPRLDARLEMPEAGMAALKPLLAIRALPEPAAEWLGRALRAGRLESAQARIQGPLTRLPFPKGHGTFRLRARLAGVDLAYHLQWPEVTGLSGTLAVDGRQLRIAAEAGRVMGARIESVNASIHDLGADPPRLRLRGRMALELGDGVRFLERSPLQPRGFLEPAVLAGPARLRLGLDLPLAAGAEPDVFGRVHLERAAFRPRPGVPALVAVTGEVAFQGGRIRAPEVTGRLLGEPVALTLAREPESPFRAEVRGSFPARALRTALARHAGGHPLSRRLTGEVGARLRVVWGREERHAELAADLDRAALILPEPLFNGIGQPARLRASWRLDPVPQVTGQLDLGDDQWRLAARRPGERWRLGLAVGLGREPGDPELGRVRVDGGLQRLPLGDWADLVRRVAPERLGAPGAGSQPRVHADVRADRVTWRDWDLGGGRVVLNGREEDGAYVLTTDLQGQRAAGRLEWARHPDRRNELQVLLERLELPAPGAWEPPQGVSSLSSGSEGLALDLLLQAERIRVGERELEGTRLHAQIFPDRWLLHGFQTTLAQSVLRLQGSWREQADRTRLRADLDTRDFGGWLRAVGVYPSMKGGRGTFGGTLWWPGRPTEFSLRRLNGDLRLRVVEGELEEFYFLSKALATLNVLDWPRQVARGFRDVATGGLVYRQIEGALHIADGVAATKGVVLDSAPLRMTADGSLDLGRRRYDLVVRVQPLQTVDRIVSAVPIFGYLLAGDAKTVMALDYRVIGPWADPQVAPLSEAEEENPLETLIRRLREMEWQDILPWR